MSKRIPILYIAGPGRSGSTLISRILARIPGVFAVGEMESIFDYGLLENGLCACGCEFRNCPYWGQVIGKAFDEPIPEDRAIHLRDSLNRIKDMPAHLAPGAMKRRSFAENLHRYESMLFPLYEAASEASGGSILVDSTKNPCHGLILTRKPEIDLHVIHLVRDPRAVAFSWTRLREYRRTSNANAFMKLHAPAGSAVNWLKMNIGCELLRLRAKSFKRMTYESFVADPYKSISDVILALGLDIPVPESLLEAEIELDSDHILRSNPNKFDTGTVKIEMDDEWRTGLSAHQKLLVSLITFPFAAAYGYRP